MTAASVPAVRRLAYERGLRLTKARGHDRYALEHPDGRMSAYRTLDAIERALHATGTVRIDGEDFGSRFVWLCGSHHGTGAENFARLRAEAARRTEADDSDAAYVVADHPLTDPGDGRLECETCGKWVHPVIHSCKGVPVTEAAQRRAETRAAALFNAEIVR